MSLIYKSITVLFAIFLTLSSCAQEEVEIPATQSDMNTSQVLTLEAADEELNRIYKEIKRIYSDEPVFIEKLKFAQLAWIKSRDADLDLHYPKANKRQEYGSVYPMCTSNVKTSLTLQRIEFLKQWLDGVAEGDVCSGSIRIESYLEKAKVKISK